MEATDVIVKLKFIKLPDNNYTGKEDKSFKGMIGKTYIGYYSEWAGGYVLTGGTDSKSVKAYEKSIYKSLLNTGFYSRSEAKKMAKGEEEMDMCLYFRPDCFEILGQEE